MAKESYTRKKLIKILKDDGWVCWVPPKVKFKQSDVFGIIDLLALKGRKQKNIQLTTVPNISTKRKKIIAFLTSYKVELPVEIWAWSNKTKKFKKEKINLKLKGRRRA